MPTKAFEKKWDASPKGFLSKQPLSLPAIKMDYYDRNWNAKGNWVVQYPDKVNTEQWELFTRGWVVQEELLSRRRVVHTQQRTT